MVFPKDGADITSYLVDVVANPNFSNDDGASGLAAIKDAPPTCCSPVPGPLRT